ncbi:sigma-70 family RNA polymerase sigma factor [Embleya sp. MST-111070]|uniref:sigma-70 family RNA polymerase sigma factor n=1 Tax=Embleya sp. MST-111070 TaxID=3398231 RepID=UPI003F733BC6
MLQRSDVLGAEAQADPAAARAFLARTAPEDDRPAADPPPVGAALPAGDPLQAADPLHTADPLHSASRISTADEAVIRTLYLEHGGPLLGFALRLTGGDRAWAEDVVQETLLRAWRHPEALDPGRGSVRGWLCTVARNVVIDVGRARRARPPETGDAVLATVPDEGAEAEFDRAVLAWDVADAMAALSPEHRAVLLETYYRGSSVADAAKTLGVPEGTVKSRTYYALRALRVALEERGLVP